MKMPREPKTREWVRPAAILLFGLFFAKVVCLGCGLVVGRPDAALATIAGVWLGGEFLLNIWELPPFAALAGLDAAGRAVRSAAIRRGVLIGAWAGLLAPLLYAYCWVWLGIFGGEFNGTVFLLFIPLPWVAMVVMMVGAGLGGLVGMIVRRVRRTNAEQANSA